MALKQILSSSFCNLGKVTDLHKFPQLVMELEFTQFCVTSNQALNP